MSKITQAQETKFNPDYYSSDYTQLGNNYAKKQEKPLKFLASDISVQRYFDFIKNPDINSFFSEINDVRSTGDNFKYVDLKGEKLTSKTLNKGLTVRVDSDDLVKDCEERYVCALIQHLISNEYRRVIRAFKEIIKEAQKNEKKQLIEVGPWGKDKLPDGDLREGLLTAWKDYGFSPNRIVMHQNVAYTRYVCLAGQNTAGAHAVDLPFKELAELFLIEDIQLIQPYIRELEGNEIFIFLAQNDLTKDNPFSAITRFVTPFDDGNSFQVYIEQHAKYTDISVEHYSNIIATSANNLLELALKSE